MPEPIKRGLLDNILKWDQEGADVVRANNLADAIPDFIDFRVNRFLEQNPDVSPEIRSRLEELKEEDAEEQLESVLGLSQSSDPVVGGAFNSILDSIVNQTQHAAVVEMESNPIQDIGAALAANPVEYGAEILAAAPQPFAKGAGAALRAGLVASRFLLGARRTMKATQYLQRIQNARGVKDVVERGKRIGEFNRNEGLIARTPTLSDKVYNAAGSGVWTGVREAGAIWGVEQVLGRREDEAAIADFTLRQFEDRRLTPEGEESFTSPLENDPEALGLLQGKKDHEGRLLQDHVDWRCFCWCFRCWKGSNRLAFHYYHHWGSS